MIPKRYLIQAKRKNTKQPWSEWTAVDNYHRAEHHAKKCEEAGYAAQIIVDPQAKELWAILGGSNQAIEQADAILDAGFNKKSDSIVEFANDLITIANMDGAYGYVSVSNINALLEKYTEAPTNEP